MSKNKPLGEFKAWAVVATRRPTLFGVAEFQRRFFRTRAAARSYVRAWRPGKMSIKRVTVTVREVE